MKKNILKIIAITFLGLIGCNNSEKDKNEYVVKTNLQDQIQKGKELVTVIGCNDCHSPKIMTDRGPIPDPDRLLSGHNSNETLPPIDIELVKGYVLFNMNSTAVVGPWGTSFSANLTPDDTGIGTWNVNNYI